jgi:hypothetical protein
VKCSHEDRGPQYVLLTERHTSEAIKNHLKATRMVGDAAIRHGVDPSALCLAEVRKTHARHTCAHNWRLRGGPSLRLTVR